jgi:hypothetical protein
MSRTNCRIDDVTQDSAMDRPRRTRMELGLSFHLHGSGPFIYFNQADSESLHNRKGNLKVDVSVGVASPSKSFLT